MTEKPLSEKIWDGNLAIWQKGSKSVLWSDVQEAVEGLKQESERKSIKYAVLCEGYEGNHTKAVKKHLLKLIEEHQWFRRKIDEVFGK